MITSVTNAGSYLRFAQAPPSRTTLTTADALPVAEAEKSTAAGNAKPGIPGTALKALDVSELRTISKENPELRDVMATAWLKIQALNSTVATQAPDNAPQNIYATVKVNGKVVATLYNGGASVMTNDAAAKVGDLQDPPGLNGGPDLAQRRAERIAKAVGGTVEKASTAITQSEWTPRQTTSTNYSPEQLDGAFEAIMTAAQQNAVGSRSTGYSAQRESSGGHTDFTA